MRKQETPEITETPKPIPDMPEVPFDDVVSILLGSEAERKEEAEADKLPLVGLCLDRMQQALSQAISQAKDLEIWLHEKTNGRNFPSKGTDAWGVCLLQNSWDIAEAIIILLERKLPGPAWTLARPLRESFVRGVWVLHCASDEQVEDFRNGKCPSFPELLKAMDDHDEAKLHADWIRANLENTTILNDFTHGGIEHVLRRITENDEKTLSGTVVEPNYPEHELEYLVGLGTEVCIRVGHELFSLMEDSEAIGELRDKAAIIRRRATKD